MSLQEQEIAEVAGLSGSEVVVDLCEQIAQRLHQDCNLRPTDNYTSGYSAEIEIHLNLYGMDTVNLETKIAPSKQIGPVTGVAVREVETEVNIAHEPDLSAVRERSGQEEPDVERRTMDTETVAPSSQRRRYAGGNRRAGGGASSFNE